MFESNTEIEFDRIFGDDFQSDSVINTKRAIDNEVSSDKTNKKLCLDNISMPSTILSERSKIPDTKLRSLQLTVKSPNKNVVQRRFPGPAGLLPERRDFAIDIKALEANHTKSKRDDVVDADICSQMSVKAFYEGPWGRMSKDFHLNDSNSFLPDKYNIAWIKDKVKNNKLINQKAPFIAAIIQNIEYSKLKTAVVTMLLKDTTGHIHGTIIHDLYEEYINELKVGSVIVLKQFGVLTTDRGCNLYVTITPNNLVAIYSDDTDCKKNISKVKVTTIQEFSVGDFIKNIHEVKMRHKSAERLKSILGCSEINLNVKSPIQHVHNNRFSTPMKSLSSNDITVRIRDQNIQNVTSPRTLLLPSSTTSSSNANTIVSESNISSNSSSKPKFNFKLFKCNNNQTTERAIEGNGAASKNLIKNTQISIVSNDNIENNMILENVFEGVDTDLLFEDF